MAKSAISKRGQEIPVGSLKSKPKKSAATNKVISNDAYAASDSDHTGKLEDPMPYQVYGGGQRTRYLNSAGAQGVIAYTPGSVMTRSMPRPENRLTTIEKMEATKKGISKKELEELKRRAGLDYDQLSFILQVARATLIAKKGTETFPTVLSEKIMSLAVIYSYGYEVFGSEAEFNKWVFEPIVALGGRSPYDLLDNFYGREEVKHIIGRIEYGVYS